MTPLYYEFFQMVRLVSEWRGVRSGTHTYARWLNGKTELYDLAADPLQQHNIAGTGNHAEAQMRERLQAHQAQRQDELVNCSASKHWLDNERRVIRNAFGELSHPESAPDWSLLH